MRVELDGDTVDLQGMQGAEHHAQLDEMVDADEPRVEMEDLWVEGPQPICVMFSEDEDEFDDFE